MAFFAAIEIYGFVIIDDKHLYAFLSYHDDDGLEVFTCRLFFTVMDGIPYKIRCQIYRDMHPYLVEMFVKNPHIMCKTEREVKQAMTWVPKKIELL